MMNRSQSAILLAANRQTPTLNNESSSCHPCRRGPEIGYGNLIRTSVLDEELVAQNSTIIVPTTTPTSAELIFPDSVDILGHSS